jgi:N-acetylmuramoyl-L-alanine amidase
MSRQCGFSYRPEIWALAVVLAWAAPTWAQEGPGASGSLVHLAGGLSGTVPAWELQGEVFVPLRAVAEPAGGVLGWAPAPQKAVLQGPGGRKLLISPGNPRAVLDGKRLVRLPQVPRLHRSQVWVTPEAFCILWQSLGNPAPVYQPQSRTLELNPGAVSAPTTSEKNSLPIAARSTGVRCVVVDAGHGGKDPGAIGPSRLEEKDVTLEVALALADRLERDLGCKVILTRRDDRFIPLPDRPEVANRSKADLFVSVHANASRDGKASGSQVFIYNREASSNKAAETARLENRDTNYLEIIKDDLRQSLHQTDSITAAGLVSQELERGGQEARHIERAPFYVLAKSHMPSILVETAFISNRDEENKLRRQDFCRRIAEDIFKGIQQYAQEKSRTAHD